MAESKPLVLFYTSLPFLFRTTTIGHLYEICQEFPVVLLSEELDRETNLILGNKELFPNLKEIIKVSQFTGAKQNIFQKNYHLHEIATSAVKKYRPSIVVAENDIYPFEMYLLRAAKRNGSINLCIQSCARSKSIKDEIAWSYLNNSYRRLPKFLPLSLKFSVIKIGKYAKHFFYYWILPLLAGEKPFSGKSSCYLWHDIGLRDTDYLIALSEMDKGFYKSERKISDNILVLGHPLTRSKTRYFFENFMIPRKKSEAGSSRKVLTIILSLFNEFSFQKIGYLLIKEEDILENRRKILNLISQKLKGWKVYVKPHPQCDIEKVKSIFPVLGDNVEVVDPKDPADRYVDISDVIVGFPPQSTVLYTASLQCPGKTILSLDFLHELLGDYYKEFKGVEYIDNESKFASVLESINNGSYIKKYEGESPSHAGEFKDMLEIIQYVLNKNN